MPTTRGIYSCDTGVVGGADNTGHQLVRHSSGWRCRQHGASTRETQEWLEVPTTRGIYS